MSDIPFTLTDIDFLQEGLDFSEIDPVQFENFIFHLLDEMGFSNIQWRKGGEGNSATDGGRDIEATFWSVLPSASKEMKYWFEVKYRSGQLKKTAVQRTVINAADDGSKDFLVIVTNKTVSNPTIDWIKQYQSKHKIPSITIWQGHNLELILRKNPRTLSRFLPSALSFSGRCKVIESKFSNLMLLPSSGELVELWEKRDTFGENIFLTLAACLSEATYGDVIQRPWGMEIGEDLLLSVAANGILNIYPFALKCSSLNRDQSPLIKGLSYLLQCLLIRCGAELSAKVLFDPEKLCEVDYKITDKIRVERYKPILNWLFDDLAIQCSSKYCMKLHYDSPEPDYFLQFVNSKQQPATDNRSLIMHSLNDKCMLGLVPEGKYCPLHGNDSEIPETINGLQNILEFARNVIRSRTDELLKKPNI